MKVLYINRSKKEYFQDLLYSGLVKLLGVSNVIDFPWNHRFHFPYRRYPQNLGLVKGSFGGSIFNRFHMKDYSIVIVPVCHPDTFRIYLDIIDSLPASVITVFADGGDWPDVAGDLDRVGGAELYAEVMSKRPFDYIFKRECLIDRVYESNVFSLPMSFNFDRLPRLNKKQKYDVSFWAVESDPVRTKALTMLEDEFDCRKNGTVRNQVMKKYKRKGNFYLQEIADCKVVLNFRGVGWDTLRYWEVPAVGGFMISQKPKILIDNDFVDKEEVVYCQDDLSDLIELCNYYLNNEDERERISRNALQKMHEHHTDFHRAKKLIDTVMT